MICRLRVPGAGRFQEIELRIVYLEVNTHEFTGIGCAPSAMLRIGKLILPSAVVKEGKEAYHRDVCTSFLGQEQPVPLNPPPVLWSMFGIAGQSDVTSRI